MLIRLGYDIQFEIPEAVAMVGMLHVHPSRVPDLREPDEVSISPEVKVESYHRQLRQSLCPMAGAGWTTSAERIYSHRGPGHAGRG